MQKMSKSWKKELLIFFHKIKNYFYEILLLISTVSLLIPPLNLVALYTNQLAKIIILLLFFYSFILKRKNVQKNYLYLLLFFLLSQLASVFSEAVSINSYFQVVRNYIIVFLVYMLFLELGKNRFTKMFINLVKISFYINIFFELSLIIIPRISLDFFYTYLPNDYYLQIYYNFQRGRTYLTSFNEALLGFFYSNVNWGTLLAVICSSILTFSSQFRTKLVMLIASFIIPVLFIVTKVAKIKREILIFCILIVTTIFCISFLQFKFNNEANIIQRLSFDDGLNSYQSVITRFTYWIEGAQIGLEYPIFGVGIGNYANTTKKLVFSPLASKAQKTVDTNAQNPHNIFISLFVESGLVGLISFIIILSIFLKMDVKLLLTKEVSEYKYTLPAVVGFWLLFFYSLLNPSTDLGYNILFWLFRLNIFYLSEAS